MNNVIRTIINILVDCLRHPNMNCRILAEGDVPLGDKAHVKITSTREKELNSKLLELEEENRILKKSISIEPKYKWSLIGTLSLTLLSFAVLVVLSSQAEMNSQQADFFQTCSTTWKMGFGAIIGLLGGKALK